ncbi:hypothetical protein [Sphingobacterium sp. IITKGP-BTPF85]|uniref:hypothetical protein n=1 Tax=Sphingobacterium sp. IITKGP-BTPF85 TaxID=1338009 RepID=UPI0018CDCF65|nr:hypothetical protein [Sphingobacterium sp. IITKGP-BTPF85]
MTSKNTVEDENPTWYPLTVADVNDYLLSLDCEGSIFPMQESALLVIEDALNHIDEVQLQGEVFIEINHLQELQDKINFMASDTHVFPTGNITILHSIQSGFSCVIMPCGLAIISYI